MSNTGSVLKNKKVIGILAVVLIVIIIGAAIYLGAGGTAAPTMSSMAGTYEEQVSSGTAITITLYDNGTALFSTISGTWHIVNATTFEGTYKLITTRNDYFTITNNGFTSVQTGNVYIKK
jgi:hypothetical protein